MESCEHVSRPGAVSRPQCGPVLQSSPLSKRVDGANDVGSKRGGSCGRAAMPSIFVFVCGLLVLLKANKVSHRTHVVEAAWCKRHDKAQRGDEVKIGLVAASRIEGVDHISAGAAEQQFVVGRHAIPALNTALLGMCVGEVRKVSLYWDGKPGLQYQVRLLQRLEAPSQKRRNRARVPL